MKNNTTQNSDLINIENKDKNFVNYNCRLFLSKAMEQKDKLTQAIYYQVIL